MPQCCLWPKEEPFAESKSVSKYGCILLNQWPDPALHSFLLSHQGIVLEELGMPKNQMRPTGSWQTQGSLYRSILQSNRHDRRARPQSRTPSSHHTRKPSLGILQAAAEPSQEVRRHSNKDSPHYWQRMMAILQTRDKAMTEKKDKKEERARWCWPEGFRSCLGPSQTVWRLHARGAVLSSIAHATPTNIYNCI